jgi:hypothetical protein
MARKVFFSFHFGHDAWRVGQVRNSNVVTNYDKNPFLDHADWETIQRQGDKAVKAWIDDQLKGSSVTVVLIGNQTSTREWVKYEIEKSWDRGNGLLGIYIHNIKDQYQQVDAPGINPFARFNINGTSLGNYVKTYDWSYDNGRLNMRTWIEEAAQQRGR